MQILLANCKRYCEDGAVKFLCLRRHESARFVERP